MNDWQDEDAILDQILSICAPENSADFATRKSRAETMIFPSLEGMANATAAVYADCFQRSATAKFTGIRHLSKERLLQGVATNPRTQSAANAGVHHAVARRMLHMALRLRHTSLGHWLYRNIPVGLQRRIKNYLSS
jgi:hypothetical protein